MDSINPISAPANIQQVQQEKSQESKQDNPAVLYALLHTLETLNTHAVQAAHENKAASVSAPAQGGGPFYQDPAASNLKANNPKALTTLPISIAANTRMPIKTIDSALSQLTQQIITIASSPYGAPAAREDIQKSLISASAPASAPAAPAHQEHSADSLIALLNTLKTQLN